MPMVLLGFWVMPDGARFSWVVCWLEPIHYFGGSIKPVGGLKLLLNSLLILPIILRRFFKVFMRLVV
jgi:hypothetical protein